VTTSTRGGEQQAGVTVPRSPDPFEELEEVARVPREPWFYRFLQVMTHVFLWLNVAGVVLGFCGWMLWVFFLLLGMAGVTGVGGRDALGATAAFGLAGLLASLPYLGALVIWLLMALMGAGWSFLALDAARNLRVIRYRSGGV
jgi:hypothetical protein